jgi:hypothetical protein
MVRCRKRPFTVFALGTKEKEEKIIVKDSEILAIDTGDARQQFTIKHAEKLGEAGDELEIFVSPFC